MKSFLLLFLFVFGANGQVSVSGLSSGAYAAVQFHMIWSSNLEGAGIVAGGPYWCAQGDVAIALTSCTVDPDLIILEDLYAATEYAYETDTIDDPANLKNQKVFLFSGTQDQIVYPGVMEKLLSYYEHYVNPNLIQSVFNISSAHAMVTNDFGNSCQWFGSPYINNCDFDAAGAILNHIYGPLEAPASSTPSSNIVSIDQTQFIPEEYSTETAGMESTAYIYYPSNNCSSGPCKIHIVFHGCNQTLSDIGTTFVEHAGYNKWAETNNIIVLYPQAMKTALNPRGCWDWWGYTGVDYATYLAPQMAAGNSFISYVQNQYRSNELIN